MELGETAQEIEMVLTPGDNVVEIVARGDGGAGHQQQHLGQRIHHPARFPIIGKLGKMLQQQCQTRTRRILVRKS